MKYKQAHDIAIKIYKKLEPFCTYIDLCGGLAMEYPIIDKIEIICSLKEEVRSKSFMQEIINLGLLLSQDIELNDKVIVDLGGIELRLTIVPHTEFFVKCVLLSSPQSFIENIFKPALDKHKNPAYKNEWELFHEIGLTWREPKNRL